ncbi:MAG TPA: hypothetical protein VF041_02585 [Gemmatimonadaceae bacterium]
MRSWPFEPEVREIVALLARGAYDAIERRSAGIRLSAAELEEAVARYGRRLTVPPADAEPPLDVVPHDDGGGWSVDVPLWTVEEGRSDLTLQLTVRRGEKGDHRIEIDDLHVL